MKSNKSLAVVGISLSFLALAVEAAEPAVNSVAMPWQQLSKTLDFKLIPEREKYTNLDRSARLVFAVETGNRGPALDALTVDWTVRGGNQVIVQKQDKIEKGLLSANMDLASLPPGRYDVSARLMKDAEKLSEQSCFFRIEKVAAPAQEGRVALALPSGQPLKDATFPVQAGVPFPKGALWNTDHVRVVDAQGRVVPCGLTVRSRWGSGEASIRWLGVDFQAATVDAWWPKREKPQYFLEFGPKINPEAPKAKVAAVEQADGIAVDAGAISFLVRKKGFNLIDDVKLGGKPLLKSDPTQGLYLIDHEGATYRAANDADVKLTIEESDDLRIVVRAEGWYVKDGTTGQKRDFKLPTDKLCKFVTRIEAYAGKPYVRVLSTWINTFDTFSVRLRDMGLSLPLAAKSAVFGVEGKESVTAQVPADGVRLVQHLEDQFLVEDGAGKSLATGARSAGWVIAEGPGASVAISHRNTWQRFPKELEVLPAAVRLHVWPAHGKDHPDINIVAKNQIHRLWFAHQGREMNMAMPWEYYFAVKSYATIDRYGRLDHTAGQGLVGVSAFAMGTAVTSDLLIQFAAPGAAKTLTDTAQCFQAAPNALADPQWTCDSLAAGYIHPYDPKNFKGFEETIYNFMRGYWDTQNHGKMFGMWIYRSWHNSAYNGDGSWVHYRLFNGTHHGEAIVPWVLYARSGDPFYLTYGLANIRQLSDVQITHYTDRAYKPDMRNQVGATFHDNCISPWGGDSHIFGHQTCYNGLILGYYLTGDLRLREVLADEYQNTIAADRANPASQSDIKSSEGLQGRDNCNPVSDLFDLYQLTYDPRVLAVLEPKLDTFLFGSMGDGRGSGLHPAWGHALHNIILFQGREAVNKSLLKIMADKDTARTSAPNPAPGNTKLPAQARVPGHVWDFFGDWHGEEAYAMATILDPQSSYAADCISKLSYWALERQNARKLARVEPLVLAQASDCIRPLPRLMYALMHSTRRDLAGVLGEVQPMPGTWNGRPLRIIVREDQDQAIMYSSGF
jgi:hypothetical protein